MRDFIVLAINTIKRATAEKNRTRAVFTADRRLLPQVRCDPRDRKHIAHTAKAEVVVVPVGVASARTLVALHGRLSFLSVFLYCSTSHAKKQYGCRIFSLFGTEISYAVILTNAVEYGIILAVEKNTSFDIADFNLGKE
jgi:hypothetical protein